jgi:glutaredoxin-related protein
METLIDASTEVSVEVLSHHQNVGQNYDIRTANRCFENVAKFRYLGIITNQNLIQEGAKLGLYH